jgi:hypothetical protein
MIDFEKCGHKVRGKDDTGADIIFVHDYMTPIRHLYSAPPLGDEADGIPLYRGPFELDGREWVGDIKFDMQRHPEALASGSRAHETISDMDIKGIEAFFESGPRWVEATSLVLPGVETVPDPPTQTGNAERPGYADPAAGHWISGQTIGRAQVGDGSQLSVVTFLVPNGWHVSDGMPVCGDGRTFWGATVVEVDGWSIRLEPRPDISTKEVRDHQRDTIAHLLTHVGEIRRADGSRFTSDEAEEAIEVLGFAMTLFTGRNTACVLAVGWASGQAVWSDWGQTRPIHRREGSLDWFDTMYGSASLGELIRCCFVANRDSALWTVVKLATGYLLSAHTSTVQMRVSLPVAAIHLLADNWFTTFADSGDRKSKGLMREMGAVDKYRLFLAAMRLSPAVPLHLNHLGKLREQIAGTQEDQPAAGSTRSAAVASASPMPEPVDAVKCVIVLRNKVEHPKKNSRENISIQQWAEAGFFATDSLLLGILFMLGYNGSYLGLSANRRGTGSGIPVPWMAPVAETASRYEREENP